MQVDIKSYDGTKIALLNYKQNLQDIHVKCIPKYMILKGQYLTPGFSNGGAGITDGPLSPLSGISQRFRYQLLYKLKMLQAEL